jgi:hypothetical protein
VLLLAQAMHFEVGICQEGAAPQGCRAFINEAGLLNN